MRALVLSALLSACTWSGGQVARQAVFGALMATDLHQTRQFTKECNELNPIIGKCGDGAPVVPYFAIMMLAHTLVVALLPKKHRAAFQWFSLGVQGSTVVRNVFL